LHLAGGSVPSIDISVRRPTALRRASPGDLEELVAQHGRAAARVAASSEVFLDVDTTVMPLFGEQEGARPGPNPRYHGRPSYHPILARVAQTGTIIGARLATRRHGSGRA
jgi:hypothetical protein